MLKWLRKMFTEKPKEIKAIQTFDDFEKLYKYNDDPDELLELHMLEDPICGKHHG